MANFLLSKKAVDMGWDTFIFIGRSPAYLLIGYSQDRLGPITSDALTHLIDPLRFGGARIIVHKVELHRTSPTTYMAKKTSPCLDGAQELDKGTYGWLATEGEFPDNIHLDHIGIQPSYIDIARSLSSQYGREYGEVFDVPISLEDQAWERRCLVTGQAQRREDVQAVWIFPPLFSLRPMKLPKDEEVDNTVDNVVLLHKDLVPYFDSNAFCVDIEDNYKVQVFQDMGCARTHLPPYLNLAGSGTERFWQEHYIHTLRVCLMGGDISDECPVHEVMRLMVDLNICSGIGGEASGEQVPFSDERWNSRIGRILKEYLEADTVPNDASDLSPRSSGSTDLVGSFSSTTPLDSSSSSANSQDWWNFFGRIWSLFM